MKVAQLIEALRAMPQDAEVLTYANNHWTSYSDTARVGAGLMCFANPALNRVGVLIGNWDERMICATNGPRIRGGVIVCHGAELQGEVVDGVRLVPEAKP